MSRLFDSHVIVDWSARSAPSPKRESADAIWWTVARDGRAAPPVYARTRAAAVAALADLLAREVESGRRVLVGFDFPFGYPAGVAARLTGEPNAYAVWDWLAARVDDRPDNANRRFAVAEEINGVYDGTGPCWGRPANWDHPVVPTRATSRQGSDHPPERRLADARMRGAKTVWQLAYTGSVGSQVLLGLPALKAIREEPRLAGQVAVWPFDGFGVPGAPVVLAEIYPSLLREAVATRRRDGEVLDAAQTRVNAEAFARLDEAGALEPLFARPERLSDAEAKAVMHEEAWILGLGHKAALEGALNNSERPHNSEERIARSQAGRKRLLPGQAPGGTALQGDAVPLEEPAGELHAAGFTYLRDPRVIYERSFAAIRAEAPLAQLPPDIAEIAIRIIHACGMPDIAADLAFSPDAVRAGRAALASGAPILCDANMVAQGVIRRGLPAATEVIVTIDDPRVPEAARAQATTRSAAAVDLWADRLSGAVVAIGNAPTALFRLLELILDGAPKPALILGFPVGFVGAAESKQALAGISHGVPFLTLPGRRGGSAMAAAAVNGLALGLAGDGT